MNINDPTPLKSSEIKDVMLYLGPFIICLIILIIAHWCNYFKDFAAEKISTYKLAL